MEKRQRTQSYMGKKIKASMGMAMAEASPAQTALRSRGGQGLDWVMFAVPLRHQFMTTYQLSLNHHPLLHLSFSLNLREQCLSGMLFGDVSRLCYATCQQLSKIPRGASIGKWHLVPPSVPHARVHPPSRKPPESCMVPVSR